MSEDDFLDELEQKQELCEACDKKKKRGRKLLKDTLQPAELDIEEEMLRAEASELLATRERTPVSELEHNRMNALREQGETIASIVSTLEKEFGTRRSNFSIEYHTNPMFKESWKKKQEDGYYDRPEAKGVVMSDHSKEYAIDRQRILEKFKSLGTSESEIREIMLAPVWSERGKIVRDKTFDVDLMFTKFEEDAVKAANELNDKEHLNTILARSRLTPFDVQKFKRKLEEYGMQHYADAVSLAKVKKAKKAEDYDLSEGNWDRVDSSLGD